MTLVILFVFGTIVGSFLNVVGLRWDSKYFGGRSACPHCGKTLGWFELVPILSFLVLRGRCSACRTPISWQYPLVEIWSGLIFSSLFYVIDPTDLVSFIKYLVFVAVFSIYVVITIYDARHKIIPNSLVYSSIGLGLFLPFLTDYSLLDLLAGPAIFLFFASIWFLSKGRAMGFGDAKLGLSIGLLLGAQDGLEAFLLSFWLALAASLLYLFGKKIGFIKSGPGLTMKSEVPFGPAMVLGAWVAAIFDLNFLHVIQI